MPGNRVKPINKGRGHFDEIALNAVPRDRKGKHHELVADILEDLQKLRPNAALRIPRSALQAAKVEHIRAALTRAATKAGLSLASRVDKDFFYVWRNGSHN
jgi:hypothetical protein